MVTLLERFLFFTSIQGQLFVILYPLKEGTWQDTKVKYGAYVRKWKELSGKEREWQREKKESDKEKRSRESEDKGWEKEEDAKNIQKIQTYHKRYKYTKDTNIQKIQIYKRYKYTKDTNIQMIQTYKRYKYTKDTNDKKKDWQNSVETDAGK